MRYSWQYPSLLLLGEIVAAQRVLQGNVQHFESLTAGPWQPLLSLGFGTPPQEITGIFDSGSSDTIIPLAGSPLCQVPNQQCTEPAPEARDGLDVQVRGEFNIDQAADVEQLPGESFNATFSGGDGFDGEYIKTTVTVGTDGQVPGAQVALASGGQPAGDFPQFSIYGVGPRENEATGQKYDNLPQVMKDAGVIKGNSYSVVLNPTPLANGSVFFGGIDRSKFSGELQQVALDPDNEGKILDFVVKMSSVRLDMSGGNKNNNQTAKVTKDQQRARMRLKRSIYRRASTRGRGKAGGTYGGRQAVGVSSTRRGSHNSNGGNGGNGNSSNGGNGNGGNGGNCNNNNNNNGNGNGNGRKNGKNGNGDNDNGNNGNGNNGNGNNGNGNNGNGNNGNNGNNGSNNGNGTDNNGNGNNGNGNNGNGTDNNGNGLINLGLKEDEGFTLFDTGGVDLTLPAGVLKRMAQALDADFSKQDGIGPVECSKLNADNKLVMGFNDDSVQVSLALDKIRVSEDQANPALAREGLCEVGAFAVPPDDNLSIMGFPFYTDVYTVFDLENNSLWFAQAKGDPSAPGEQLEEFP